MGIAKVRRSIEYILREDEKLGKIKFSECFSGNNISENIIVNIFEKLKKFDPIEDIEGKKFVIDEIVINRN